MAEVAFLLSPRLLVLGRDLPQPSQQRREVGLPLKQLLVGAQQRRACQVARPRVVVAQDGDALVADVAREHAVEG
jgi:hypothetical protein